MTRHDFLRKITRSILGLAIAFGIQTAVPARADSQALLALDHPEAQAVMAVQRAFTPELMQLPAILGTAIGLDDAGRAALIIYVDNESPARAEILDAIPSELGHVPVKIEHTEKFVAFASHTAKQAPPIQLGTSGGWSYDLANG